MAGAQQHAAAARQRLIDQRRRARAELRGPRLRPEQRAVDLALDERQARELARLIGAWRARQDRFHAGDRIRARSRPALPGRLCVALCSADRQARRQQAAQQWRCLHAKPQLDGRHSRRARQPLSLLQHGVDVGVLLGARVGLDSSRGLGARGRWRRGGQLRQQEAAQGSGRGMVEHQRRGQSQRGGRVQAVAQLDRRERVEAELGEVALHVDRLVGGKAEDGGNLDAEQL